MEDRTPRQLTVSEGRQRTGNNLVAPMRGRSSSVARLSLDRLSCALGGGERSRPCAVGRSMTLGTCLAPREARKRKNLQFALHAHACSLRCTLGAIRSGTRYAKWAGGSRSQTHRRAAMGCGFTQDDSYVRGVAPTHDCSSRSLLHELWIGQTQFSL
jgi:hypothetical protein